MKTDLVDAPTRRKIIRDPFRIIKARMKETGVTLGLIAAVAGTTRGAIGFVAHGTSKSKRLRLAICQMLDLDPKDLGWSKDHQPTSEGGKEWRRSKRR